MVRSHQGCVRIVQAGRCLQTPDILCTGMRLEGKGLGLPGLGLPGLETQRPPLAGSGGAQLGTTRESPWTQQRGILVRRDKSEPTWETGWESPCPSLSKTPLPLVDINLPL